MKWITQDNIETFVYDCFRWMIIIYALLYIILLICSIVEVPLTKYSPTDNLYNENTREVLSFSPISQEHPMGTDFYGYDIFSQIYYGIKTNFIFSLIGALVFLIVGTLLGVRLGYYSDKNKEFFSFINGRNVTIKRYFLPKITNIHMWERIASDIINSFPLILLLLLATIFLDTWIPSTNKKLIILMALFGLFSSPRLASMIMGKIQTLRSEEFILSAKALGLSNRQIIWKHIIWYECRYVLLFQTTYIMGQASILEITLTYLNLGAQFPWVSWGSILVNMGSTGFHIYILFPIIFITLTIYMFMRFAEEIKVYGEKRNL